VTHDVVFGGTALPFLIISHSRAPKWRMKAATPRRAARLEPERKADVSLRRFEPYTKA